MSKLETVVIMNCSKTKNTKLDAAEQLEKVKPFLSSALGFVNFLNQENSHQFITLQQRVQDQIVKIAGEGKNHGKSIETLKRENGDLPAFLRYSGRVFHEVSLDSWLKALQNSTLDIWILTAFRGIVRYTECLPNYDLTIHDKLFSGKSMRRWWRENFLPQIIWNAIENARPQKIIIIASKSYQPLLPMKKILEKDSQFEVEIPYFPGGMGSLQRKGKWLDLLLSEKLLVLKTS